MRKKLLLSGSIFMFLYTTLVVIAFFSSIDTFDKEQKIVLAVMITGGYLMSGIYMMIYLDEVFDKHDHPEKF